jgi:hypothetical protein
MKKILVLSVFFAALIAMQQKESPKAATPAPVAARAQTGAAPAGSFGNLLDNMNPRKQTKLYVKEYWKKVKGTEVTWSGVVQDVKGGSSKAKVYVADKLSPLHSGYNIVLVTHDIDKAASLMKGKSLRFTGSLSDFRSKSVGGIVTLTNAQIL